MPESAARPQVCLYMATERFDLVSWIIRRHTNCAWSHVGFFDTETRMTLSAECDGKGIAWRPPKEDQTIILLDAIGVDVAFARMQAMIGTPYDFKKIVGIALGMNLSTPGKEICDSSVFRCFEETGNPLVNPEFIPREHLTPRDILLSEKVTLREAV